VHLVDTRAWRTRPFAASTRATLGALRRELREEQYEIAVDLQAAIRSALLNWLSRAPQRIGFAKPREALSKLFYTRSVATPATHVVEQGLQLAASISGEAAAVAEFPLAQDCEAERWAAEKLAALGERENLALINAGAGWGAKCWPPQRFGEVAAGLAQRNFLPLINSGPGEEPLAEEAAAASAGAARVIACTLPQLLALIRRARLFIGGDTGPVHLAAACNVPVVALYGPTDPARNGPYAPGGKTARISTLRSAQSRTSHARKSRTEPGMLQITATDVLREAERVLGGQP
jgi:heptosyltransferase-1